MSNKVYLYITAGPMKGKVFPFEEHDTFVFGRTEDCHCPLPDDNQVSRHHFLMEANPPDARIRDLGSLNGTYVNEKKIGSRKQGETPEQGAQRMYPEVDLKNGDIIKAGQTVLNLGVEIGAGKRGPVLCRRCGKDVRKEIGDGRVGDYICLECRKSIEHDPLAQMLKELVDSKEEPPPKGAPTIKGYEIKSKLGEGGFGAVYLAERKKDKMPAAIKIMLSRVAVELEAREKFQHEISMMKDLKHPNLVQLYEHGAVGSAFYFVMEFCEAGSMADLLRRRGGRLTLEEAKPLMMQALEGLAYVHEKGFVHRDLKPENILLKGQRADRISKIADLGFAKNFEKAGFSGMTVTGAYAGTPAFMPREQLINFKYVKPVSDVWSLAATFYVMLTGTLPREFPRGKDPMEVILHGAIKPIRESDKTIPKSLARIIDQALSNDAKARPADAGEMLKELRKA